MTNISWLIEQERIANLVGHPVSALSESDRKYFIEDVFSTPEKVHFFVQFAKSDDWVLWVFNNGIIDHLFDPQFKDIKETPHLAMLSNWVSSFVDSSSDIIFHCLQQRNSKLSPLLWFDIARRINYEKTITVGSRHEL